MQKPRGRNEQIVLRPVLGKGKASRNETLRVFMDGVNHELNFQRQV